MDRKFKEIEEKVKKSLGIDKFPDYELKIDSSLGRRTAFNQKVGDKYLITISVEKDKKPNYNGFKHELIHLALKKFSYDSLEINLPVPKKYEKDDKTVRFMEYLTIIFEIKMGNSEKVEENLTNFERDGFKK
ncbi:MAG: hypothetical protein NT039_04245 [Candidatus Berkelbacteria bacterium]|nr:hypothetical protein [Candidatus Berkelbacteria bacterium]